MITSLQATSRKAFLPRLSNACRWNAQSFNAISRVGIRQASMGPTVNRVKAVAKPGLTVHAFKGVSVAALGLGLAFSRSPTVQCDALSTPSHARSAPRALDELPPPPESAVSVYQLGFGTVAGLCAGIFVKKGAKAAAWLLGGVFVLLQYLASQSLVRVDWTKAASRFENQFHTTDVTGRRVAPTIGSVWKWLTDFLTADFQPRASFLAGFALGIRVG